MNLYLLALFAHLCGVVSLFAGMGAIAFGVAALWKAQTVGQVRLLTTVITAASNFAAGGIVLLGLVGLYMAVTVWGKAISAGDDQAMWIVVATVGFILLAPGGLLVIDPRVKALSKLARAAADGPLSDALAWRARDPLLASGLCVYIACLLGIVYLMTIKPALGQSIEALVIAVAIGALVSAPIWLVRGKRLSIQAAPSDT